MSSAGKGAVLSLLPRPDTREYPFSAGDVPDEVAPAVASAVFAPAMSCAGRRIKTDCLQLFAPDGAGYIVSIFEWKADFMTDEEIIRLYLRGVKVFPEHMVVNPKHDEVAADGAEHKREA